MDIKKAFSDYLDIQPTIDSGEFAPYNWLIFPDPLPINLMVYQMMANEQTLELSNSINELNRLIASLCAWAEVLSSLDDKDKNEIMIEFVDTKAITALNLPYVIRSRFIFSIAHLCHQANRFYSADWQDDLPLDKEIFFQSADKYGVGWKKYRKAKVAIEGIFNQKHQCETKEYRNKYHHRYSPRIEVGITNLVSRNINDDGDVSYGLGGCQPLKLAEIIPLLREQQVAGIRAYKKYQMLLFEHMERSK